MTSPATIGELRAILDGLEGVTPGPWWSDGDGGDEFKAYAVFGPHERYGKPSSICDTHNAGEVVLEQEDGKPWDEQGRKNLAHIARLDPETVRSIVTELLARRSSGLGPVSVKPLEWREITSPREDGDPEPTGDFEASDHVGGFYHIRCYFGSDSYGWETTWGPSFVADKDNPDDAMAAASAHHRELILSAVSCLTSIGVEAGK